MGFRSRIKCSVIALFLVAASHAYGAEGPIAGRVVSLAPSITETLFAMGLGHRVAGTTEHSDYPPEAADLPSVGQFMNPELERILALHPEACVGLVGSTSPRLVQMLKKFDVPTLLVNVSRLEGLLCSINEIGAFLGERELSEKLQQAYRKRLKSIHDQIASLPTPRVLTIISVSPLFSAGPNTFISDIVRCAGGDPVGLDDGKAWQGLSREAVLWLNPDVIVFAAHTGTIPEWMKEAPLDGTRIISIDPSLIIRPTPRLVDTAGDLAAFLHGLD
ncbi:MAG: helical backbone metal receptor [Pseudomonadota bacterium]